MLSGKRIVVTGSSGFVGAQLVKALEQENARVFKLDIESGYDLSSWEKIKSFCDFDMVFHLAAKSYVPDSYKNPYDFYHNNINSTLNMLELCRVNHARMVYISSYVYGVPQYLPIDEEHPVVGFNPYAQSKIICERLCEGYNRDHDVPVVIIRPSNIYGKGQKGEFLIPTILGQLTTGKIQLRDPRPKRDFIYIDDLIDFFIQTASYDVPSLEIFNVGYGQSFSVREIVGFFLENIPDIVGVEYADSDRKIEAMDTVLSISKAKNKLDWEPNIAPLEGIRRMIYENSDH